MKPMQVTFLAFVSSLLGGFGLHAQVTAGLTVTPFSEVTDDGFLPGGGAFFFAPSPSDVDGSAATHLLLSGLEAPDAEAPARLVGSYQAVALPDGESFDRGLAVVELPAPPPAPPANTFVSPIVGIIPRTGAWDNYAIETPAATFAGDGSATYTPDGGTFDVSFALNTGNGQQEGAVEATVLSTDEVELASFTLGTATFSGTTLTRDGMVYEGFVERIDAGAPAAWQQRFYALAITDTADSDGDGVPDFSDEGNVPLAWWGDSNLGDGWFFVAWMDAAVRPEVNGSSWHFHATLGFIWTPADADEALFWSYMLPGDALGWMFTNSDIYPSLYRWQTGDWLFYTIGSTGPRVFTNLVSGEVEEIP